jgi:hypothetical protein
MFFWLLIIINIFAQEKVEQVEVVKVMYFKPILGHVHQTPLKTSPSMTLIQCGYPLKVLKSTLIKYPDDWNYVEASDIKGFVVTSFLSDNKPDCFQAKYPKYFEALNSDIAELYYWGRLYDQFLVGESKVK